MTMVATRAARPLGDRLFGTESGVALVHLRATDALPALCPEELPLLAPMVPARRREFAWGREAARQALAAVGEGRAALLPDGDRVPIWPRGTTGSITHSGRICAAAVMRGTGALGLDIEREGALDPTLWPELLTDAELARLHSLPAAARDADALVLFTAKEAVFKAHFALHRQMFGFLDIEVSVEPDGRFVATFAPHMAQRGLAITGRWHRGPAWTASGVRLAPRGR